MSWRARAVAGQGTAAARVPDEAELRVTLSARTMASFRRCDSRDLAGEGDVPDRHRQRDAVAALERTIPEVYRWTRLVARELAESVSGLEGAAGALGIYRYPRVFESAAVGFILGGCWPWSLKP
jgi:hypothetical protein